MNTPSYAGVNFHALRSLGEALKDPNYNPVVYLGDGQIAMMGVQECRRRGIPVIVIGNGEYARKSLYSPAEQALGKNDYYINCGDAYANLDQTELAALVNKLKITGSSVSAEFESVPVSVLEFFESQGVRLTPGKEAFSICRNKLREKEHFRKNGIPCTDFMEIDLEKLESQRKEIDNLLPGFVKIQELGYDGKGQVSVESFDQIKALISQKPEGSTGANAGKFYGKPCILEKKVEFEYEMSVVLLRDKNGEIVVGAVPKNFQDNGILVASAISEDVIPQNVKDEAIDYAIRSANGMNYEGLLVVEFFVDKNGSIRANEMAPRAHNSGHHTIESMMTSQYLLQALLSHGPQTIESILASYSQKGVGFLNKGSYRQARVRHQHVALINLLGKSIQGVPENLGIQSFGPGSDMPNIRWGVQHILKYGKEDPRGTSTKMGHVVISAKTLDELVDLMESLIEILHPDSQLPWRQKA